jgi:hypothetical protein
MTLSKSIHTINYSKTQYTSFSSLHVIIVVVLASIIIVIVHAIIIIIITLTLAGFALVIIAIIVIATLSLAGFVLAIVVIIITLARAAFDLAGFFPLPLSSSSSSPHS